MKKSCIIYCRISDKDQSKGDSIDTQERICREYAQKKNIEVLGVYADIGISGRNIEKREELMRGVINAKEKDADYVLVTETDRFSRNIYEHLYVKEYLKKFKCQLIAVNQPHTERDDATANLVDTIVSAVNQFFSELYGEKTKAHLLMKIKKGDWTHIAPVGYKNFNAGSDDKPNNIIGVDENIAPLVVEAFQHYSTGNYNAEKLRNIMHKKGLVSRKKGKIAKSSFINMLRNPFYYGQMLYKGKLYPGNHEPLISKKLFDKCQQILDVHNQSASRSRKHDERFYLRHFLECGICGGKFTAEEHKKKNVCYYHCSLTKKKHSNRGQNIQSDVLEDMIADCFKHIEISKSLAEKITNKAQEILKETHGDIDKKRKSIQNKINTEEQKRNNLEEDRLERVISVDIFKRQHEKIEQNLENLKTQLQDLDDDRSNNIETFNKIMMLTENLYKTYIHADNDLKQNLISLFFEKFVMKDTNIIDVRYTKFVESLLLGDQVIIKENWLLRLDSNQ